ncbi:MAG: hypothetical protein IPL75_11735 [Acidobacteria bacterium]|nr:hypothetical protein [Acidobacteriota bacterium]
MIADVERERSALNRVKNPQLHSARARESLRGIVERYFNEVRPSVAGDPTTSQHIEGVDAAMQALLSLCHKKGSVQKYRDLLRQAKGHLIHLDSGIVARAGRQGGDDRNNQDIRIVTTLRALLPSAGLSYEQALLDLSAGERLSWRGPATDLREALRETLDHLAPDNDVLGAAGYKQEPNTNGPTMKQKVRYMLRNRGQSKATAATTEDATAAIDEALGTFVRSVYTRSSVSTHTPTDIDEVLRLRDLVRVVLGELLEAR